MHGDLGMSENRPVMPSTPFLFQMLEGNRGQVSQVGNAVSNEVQLGDGTTLGVRVRPSTSTGWAGDTYFGDMTKVHADRE